MEALVPIEPRRRPGDFRIVELQKEWLRRETPPPETAMTPVIKHAIFEAATNPVLWVIIVCYGVIRWFLWPHQTPRSERISGWVIVALIALIIWVLSLIPAVEE